MSDPSHASASADPVVDENRLEGLIIEAQTALPVELPALANRCASALGLDTVLIYLVDLQQRLLIPLDETLESLPVADSLAGWAYRTVSPRVADADDGVIVWMPLVDGAERLGVLAVRTASLDGARIRRSLILAHLLAMLITSKRAYSDWLVARTRTETMRLPTEMLRAFLPPRTIGSSRCVSTAVLEPAYDVAGDAFDHSVVKDVLHTLILDSMGHDLTSGLTASVAMAAARNARRGGCDLADVVGFVDQALARWLPDQFCTGVLCRLDAQTGVLRWVNCGHPPPLLIRAERVLDGALDSPPQPPIGLAGQLAPAARQVHETTLEPGDCVLLYTDGVIEARDTDGAEFGLHRFTDFIIRSSAAGQRPAEVLRLLIHAILDHQRNQLRDDATILLFEWHPQHR
ncbi:MULTISPECIES: PP2C family protein-serine/threonine phosphatase [unclassified Streptomyces]|uniref:PP2C family protein-serine/threonine phosphatase n=1 Tax=unclassified Streptomyces TaxID=2593676 RepID=UPI002259764B|nr:MULTISPECIES: PP2C family protein-serine/threonine phosphatase [unclassified Streptomyces]MCX5443805.1 serine/threonine-protein phosphatase [Streptomyces sp. NBC_00063]WUB90857.1 serine/threonine-protein phosphatase [Streptomyces sp. NBC_00569]WUB99182.1 serine/threonine-protein phosphatase [Streptomyces sp. NBC_00569]